MGMVGLLLGGSTSRVAAQTLFSESMRSEQWAVVVGISHYEDASIPSLAYAARDARRVADTLLEGGMPEEHLFLLENGEATRAALLELLESELPARLAGHPGARLLIYWGGHGLTQSRANGQEMGFLMPFDGRRSVLEETAIPMDRLLRKFTPLEDSPARHLILLVDACYSGYAIDMPRSVVQRPPPRTEELAAEHLWSSNRRSSLQVLTAGTADQVAIERDGSGVMTLAVISGLRGEADLDGDHLIFFDELAYYVERKVHDDTRGTQTPMRIAQGEGQYVFVLNRALEPEVPPGIMIKPSEIRSVDDPGLLSALLSTQRRRARWVGAGTAVLALAGAGLMAGSAHDFLGAGDRPERFEVDRTLFLTGAGLVTTGAALNLVHLLPLKVQHLTRGPPGDTGDATLAVAGGPRGFGITLSGQF